MKSRNKSRASIVRQPAAQLYELPGGYSELLNELKDKIRSSRVKAALSANHELVLLYWHIGKGILGRQQKEGWGAKVIDRLSVDLTHAFPEMKGFSPRNLKYMRAFAEAYSGQSFVQQVAAQIPWFHNCTILDKVTNPKEREWYLKKTIENGWSRNILALQIESGLHRRHAKAVTNFKSRLPKSQSDLAEQTLKDPYIFDFLSVGQEAHEREIEKGLVHHITKFLLELGAGFSFVGQQYHLELGDADFYIDLLFYHLKLRCYVVIELKAGKFKPDYAGQLNFYLSAIDSTLRHQSDNPTIGLILCKNKDRLVAEYALRDIQKPIGVANWQTKIVESLPKEFKGSLPTVEEIEAELEGIRPK